MPETTGGDALGDLPPSAKLVYIVLEANDELTVRELAEETLLSVRTVRDAIRRLEAANHVSSAPNPRDARQRKYAVTDAETE